MNDMNVKCLFGFVSECPVLTRIYQEIHQTNEYVEDTGIVLTPSEILTKYLAVTTACRSCPHNPINVKEGYNMKKRVPQPTPPTKEVREIKLPPEKERPQRGEIEFTKESGVETQDLEEIGREIKERYGESVDVAVGSKFIMVTPKEYLGKELWSEINSLLKDFGFKWISQGRDSHWIKRTEVAEENE